MVQFIFVFSACSDERIAFSIFRDGGNLPPSTSRAPWLPSFRTTLTDSSFSLFGVDPISAVEAIRTTGFFVGERGSPTHPRTGVARLAT